MKYSEALESLRKRGNEVQAINLGLQRTCAMMEALGRPNEKFPALHITGTNGKGSVAAMSESMLRHAGWLTGIYTSPHLVRIEERIRVNGRQISPRGFAALATRIQETEATLLFKKLLDRPLTTFEFLTTLAFLYFAEMKVDLAVIEVGLGGKLDATNVVLPQVCVITGISLDHQNLLGNTITEIAGEKAGIIKKRVPIISGCRNREARRVICRTAKAAEAPLLEISRDCEIRIKRKWRGRYSFDLVTPCRSYRDLHLSLAGEYQTCNAALAVMAVEVLKSFPVRAGDVRRGLANTSWPGRLDEYRSQRRTLLDGAHNPEGAQLLQNFLVDQKEDEVHFVFGALRDKNIREMGGHLFPLATSIHLTPLENSRSADPSEVADQLGRFRPRMRFHRSMHGALYSAWKECSRSGLVVVSGSLYLVGDLLPIVKKSSPNPNAPKLGKE